MSDLRARFVVSGALVVVVMAIMGWACSHMFARVSRGVADELAKDEQKGELLGALGSALEDEDDALLLALSGDVDGAARRRRVEQGRFDEALTGLSALVGTGGERAAAEQLGRHVAIYRRSGDALLTRTDAESARVLYDAEVTQAMHAATSDLQHLRTEELLGMRRTAAWARDEARRARTLVALVSIAALLLSLGVSVQLARAILGPIRELTRNVAAVREGAFDRRIRVERDDEIGALAEGYNRMAAALGLFSASKLGEVLRAKATLEATLAGLPAAVVLIHDDGRVAAANRRAASIFVAACGVVPSDLEALGATADGAKLADAILRAGHAVVLERAVRLRLREGGEERRLLAMTDGASDAGAQGLRVVVLSDVTELARLDEMRMDFVAAASHELRTPLTTLRMMLSLLSEAGGARPAHEEEMLRTALTGCEQLGQTVDTMLELAHAETGNIRLRRERVAPAELARRTLAAMEPRARDAEVDLRLEDESSGEATEGDVARLLVVLSNVLSNALKYSPRGGRIEVTLRDAGDLVELSVSDRGPGVPPELRERIFEKYFRVEHHRDGGEGAHGPRGAGMGLYLCRQIVEAHGGRIDCSSGEDGVGARITLRLPKSQARRSDARADAPLRLAV